MNTLKFIIILVSVLPTQVLLAQALELPAHCGDSNIRKIQVPTDYSIPSKKFTHRYQVHNWGVGSGNTPVIIGLPGGPGYGWTSDTTAETFALENGFPLGSPILLVDPRGANCNLDLDGSIPASTYRSRTLALDVAEIIQAEKLSNYIVYGGSYGTVWGTHLYREIVRKRLPLPKSLVLDGTLGHTYTHLMGKNYSRLWAIRKYELPDQAFDELSENPLPFGFKPESWARYIFNLMGAGTLLEQGMKVPFNPLKERLSWLSGTPEEREALRKKVAQFELNPVRGPDPVVETSAEIMQREIDCHELNLRMGSLKLIDGHLINKRDPEESKYCRGIRVDEPFDSKKFSIRVPIVYLMGKVDPQTIYSQAIYHFENQIHSPARIALITPSGGHWGLGRYFNDCAENLWKSIIDQNWSALSNNQIGCQIPYRLKMKI